ncbi:fimbria/pilus outer membrane usher protein [Pseudomonas agarici]|uniref:fimbria/pilus outer membrane usher protein n=1 Tax=Pseudomonas agarici TaxID=46677 RepID=UPI0002DE55FC|nr:fimbria/pilus outer membrane usher protein [Pseudomonas agarici]NWB91137.1 fimbrial biogenesis outer membrane usher protein [Pseudomonas agarici]NWC09446.1 fimbrial biogenesis outer membrane usher protein [Pseudomonas agarici]SEL60861.1 outer membrane usher protein [Pseudomonas agarici]
MRSKTQSVPGGLRAPRNRLAHVIHSLLLLAAGNAWAANEVERVEFNPAFFPGGGGQIDISRFNEGNVVLPGLYRADVSINGNWIGQEELTFATVEGQNNAQLCLERPLLIRLGIDLDGLAQKATEAGVTVPPALPALPTCGDIGTYIPGATASFDTGDGRLDLQVPQLYLSRTARGYVSPEHWDAGVNAAFIRYNANGFMNNNQGRSSFSNYLGLHTGLNLNGWHLRHNGAYSSNSATSGYQSSATYVQRELPGLQSQLMTGEIYTSGELFDSIRLRGITLSTDDRMLPDSLTGYAPIVRGVAETNARVSVRQRGILLDEVTVPPGPFVLNDLFPTGYGGDLEVTVTESDGRQRQFIVPFASNVNLIRPGYSRYSLSVGEMNELGLDSKPWLAQGTFQYGLNNLVTGYAGVLASQGYQSQLLGAAFNTPVGAISLDLTASQAELPGLAKRQGQSLQARYNKNFADTGTNFALGAFRYSTDGFLNARDTAQLREIARQGGDLEGVGRVRERLDISLNQSLDQGSVFLTGSSQNYWNRKSGTLSFTAGYSSSWQRVNYTVSAQRSRDLLTERSSNQIDLTISLPLGYSNRAPNLWSNLSRGDRQSSAQAGLGGTWGERSELNYGVSASHADNGVGNSFNADLQYRSRYAVASTGFSQGNGYHSQSASLSGGLVAHAGGLTLTPELGDTIGLVHAPGASGAWVGSNNEAQVDDNGYAVVPHLTPYRQNVVELDPRDMSHDVELKSASQNIAPRSGSVVVMKYETSSGRAVIIDARREDNSPLPFGADVFDESEASVGVVGQNSKAFVRLPQESGRLTVKWGPTPADTCWIAYDLNSVADSEGLRQMRGDCRADASLDETGGTTRYGETK